MRRFVKPALITVICLLGAVFLVFSTLRTVDRIGRMTYYDLHYSDIAKIICGRYKWSFETGDCDWVDLYEVTDTTDRTKIFTFLNSLRLGLEAKNPEKFMGGFSSPYFRLELIDGSEIIFHVGSGGLLRSGDSRSYICYISINGKSYNCYDYGLILWFSEFCQDIDSRYEETAATQQNECYKKTAPTLFPGRRFRPLFVWF